MPQFEVIVRHGGSDVAVVAFFITEDQTLDSLVGVENVENIPSLAEVMDLAALALLTAEGWVRMDGDDVPSIPF